MSEDEAFAVLTLSVRKSGKNVETPNIDRVLADLHVSREQRVIYLAFRGKRACDMLDALQLVMCSLITRKMLAHSFANSGWTAISSTNHGARRSAS
jgi:hypothetical protein